TIRGKERLRKAQEAAIKDFGHLFLVERNITKAFDRYVPEYVPTRLRVPPLYTAENKKANNPFPLSEYINHNPFATTGRQAALDVLVPALANPNLVYDFKASFAGEGNGVLHYRMTQAGVVDYAIMDRYRFVGDCIVEHWDTA